jgi:hypothetical protein
MRPMTSDKHVSQETWGSGRLPAQDKWGSLPVLPSNEPHWMNVFRSRDWYLSKDEYWHTYLLTTRRNRLDQPSNIAVAAFCELT